MVGYSNYNWILPHRILCVKCIIALKFVRLDCKKIIDNDGPGAVPFLPFLTSHFCCGLWFAYGVLKADATVKFVNAAGMGLTAIYMVCYISFSKRKSVQFTLIILCGMLAFGLEYYLNRVIRDKHTRTEYLSLACIITTIVMQASPLFTVVSILANARKCPASLVVLVNL
ncbi:Sugar transporter SWEET1 [Exaiptasia diaphana]|nr:Sugar transporter SWEET1 [Exaiptasia diaphana]